MGLSPTPSQTLGPYFAIGLPWLTTIELVNPEDPDVVQIEGAVYDGEGVPVDDALVEIWQANRAGRYAHPEDTREEIPLEEGFQGFGRAPTDPQGAFGFFTVKPGPVPAPGGGMQAPHIEVSVMARGILKRMATRIYFPDEAEANAADPVLSSVPEEARDRLVAVPEGHLLRFDVHLQGDLETPFFVV